LRHLPGDHRVGRGLLILIGVSLTLFFGAYLFERPAAERVTSAFQRADPSIPRRDLVIVEAGARTYRSVHRGRYWRRTKGEVASTLWCAQDRRSPARRMAIEYHNSALPLDSGVRTLARSWVSGRRLVADNILAECGRLGPPALA
jgi:hypothetical protein